MPMVEAAGSCPRCGAEMTFRICPSDDAPPEAVAALKRGMAEVAEEEERSRRRIATVQRLRVACYFAAAACTGSAILFMTGSETVSKWAPVAGNATAALSWYSAAAWILNVRVWASR